MQSKPESVEQPGGEGLSSRATLIEWNEEKQGWFIRWEDSDEVWSLQTFVDAGVTDGFGGGVLYLETPSGVVTCSFVETGREYSEDRRASWPITQVFFDDYEDAVAAEAAVIQSPQAHALPTKDNDRGSSSRER